MNDFTFNKKKVRPFDISRDFRVPQMNNMYLIQPTRGENLLDDVTAEILRQIQAHEDRVFAHVHQHNSRVQDHHRKMSYHHPYHGARDHPIRRRY